MVQWIVAMLAGLFVLPGGAARADSGYEISIDPIGSARHVFTHNNDSVHQPITLQLAAKSIDQKAHHLTVTLAAVDFWGSATGWNQQVEMDLSDKPTFVTQNLTFAAKPGYFQINLSAKDADGGAIDATTDFAVVPPPHAGARPESFFQSNTAGMKSDEDLALLTAIGMKVERVHLAPPVLTKAKDWPATLPKGEAAPLDFTKQDQLWAQTKAAGMWILPVVGYALQGAGAADVKPDAAKLGMYGPPADYDRFVKTWEAILRHYPELTSFEFWNEPWIFGYTWAGTPAEYRQLQMQWCEMALKVNPAYRIVAGNSTMYVADNIEPDPSCWKGLLQGISHHPYTIDAGEANFRFGSNTRSIDDLCLRARAMGLPYPTLTEGGTEYRVTQTGPVVDLIAQQKAARLEAAKFKTHEEHQSPEFKAINMKIAAIAQAIARYPLPSNNRQNATKLVQYYVRAALAGSFTGNAQWELGYGPGWTRSNATFAVMSHFLEDRPAIAEVWPGNELLWGGIFANSKFATDAVRALPRAKELSTRWNVAVPADRADDQTKVAVLWSMTGKSNDALDTDGRLTIANADGLRAYDCVGQEIPATGGKLVLPFGSDPIYVTTDTLDVISLRDRIASATIEKVTSLNLYALSLETDAMQKQMLSVRIENQLNQPISGQLHMAIAGAELSSGTDFKIEAGKLAEIRVPWPGVAASATNQYPITLTANLAGDNSVATTVTRTQLVNVARFARRTIDVNGSLDQWNNVTPVLIDSKLLNHAVDMSAYLLNPHLEQPTGDAAEKRIIAKVYTAYDDQNIYLAAAVNEDALNCTAGQSVVKGRLDQKITLPYLNGEPGGLNHVINAGDAFEFSFGFRDRVPGLGRQMDDPWAWKGNFFDTDYSYIANRSTTGDQLTRLWGADGIRRNGYQTEAVPGQEAVPGAKIKITRDEAAKLTVYQMAIPRKELALFDPAAGRCRFGFVLYNDEKLGANGLSWAEAAGVFDHWYSSGSFPPTWIQQLPCETFFGIDNK